MIYRCSRCRMPFTNDVVRTKHQRDCNRFATPPQNGGNVSSAPDPGWLNPIPAPYLSPPPTPNYGGSSSSSSDSSSSSSSYSSGGGGDYSGGGSSGSFD